MFVVKIKDNSHETATGAIWIISILKSLLFLFYPIFTTVQLIYIAPNNSCKPITNTAWIRARLFKLQKGCTRLAVASEKVYQLLAHGRWFSPGTPASSTPKTDRHDTAEILLKVAQNTINKSINPRFTAIQLICIANECFGQKTRAPWMITQYIALGC